MDTSSTKWLCLLLLFDLLSLSCVLVLACKFDDKYIIGTNESKSGFKTKQKHIVDENSSSSVFNWPNIFVWQLAMILSWSYKHGWFGFIKFVRFVGPVCISASLRCTRGVHPMHFASLTY